MKRATVAGLALLTASLTSAAAPAQSPNDDHIRTIGGVDLGAANFKDITEADSSVRFTDSSDVKSRRAVTLSDRTYERLVLRNNAMMTYAKVFLRGQNFGPRVPSKAFAELPYSIRGDFLTSRGIKYDDHDAKQAGSLAYLVQSSSTDTCFVFNAYLGDAVSFDKQVFGNICYPVARRSVAQLEQEMLTLLSHARFPQSMDSSSFTVSFEIPQTTLAAPTPAPVQQQPTSSTPSTSVAPVSAPTKPSAVTGTSTPASGSSTIAQRLQELKDLLDRKLITPSEYEAKRKAILDAL
jgi:hypothetical protein